MIQVTNPLFEDPSFKDNFYLFQFKKIVFETDDVNLVKILISVRLSEGVKTFDGEFKYENIQDLVEDNEDSTLFISKYQILWDKFYLENNGFETYL
jgi:hypothetical protein